MNDEPYAPTTPEEARSLLDKFKEEFAESFPAAGVSTKSPELRVVLEGDIHRQIAAIMYGVEPVAVTAAQRLDAKVMNYNYLYRSGLPYAKAVPLMEAQARAFAASRKGAGSEGGG